jgi:DNA-binding NarL/FixJ family response regulator
MRILIAEKSPILRKRLTRLFSELEYVSLVAFVEDINEVSKIALEVKPEIIVIDIDFPSLANLKMLFVLKTEMLHLKILVLTETIEPRYIKAFLNSGADMVFNKKDDLNNFIVHLKLISDVKKTTPIL